jgi:hypothetical protein
MNPPCPKCGKECRPAYQQDGNDMYRCATCKLNVGRHMESGCVVMVSFGGENLDHEKYPYMKALGEWAGLFSAGEPEPR